jgi:hypothetical protein
MTTAAATNRVTPARDNATSRAYFPDNGRSIMANLDIRVGSMNAWQLNSIKKVLSYKSLNQNWDSYGSPGLAKCTVQAALSFLIDIPFSSLPMPRIVPVSGGGLQFEWVSGERELEVEVRPEGSIEILKVVNGLPLDDEGESIVASDIKPIFYWLFAAE